MRKETITWYTPEEKTPTNEDFVMAFVSGKAGENITLDHALVTADFYDGGGWALCEFPQAEEFVVHEWAEVHVE